MHGTEVGRAYRDARILGIGGGATEVLNDLTARLLGYTAAAERGDRAWPRRSAPGPADGLVRKS